MSTFTLPDEALSQFGLDLLPPEAREEFVRTIHETIFRGVMTKAFVALDEQGQDKLMQLVKASSKDASGDVREQLDVFLKENVPDLDRFVEEELGNFVASHRSILSEITGKEQSGPR